MFVAIQYKAPSGTFFEVFCLLRKTRELCPIAAAIKYLYTQKHQCKVIRSIIRYNMLLYTFNVDEMYSFSPYGLYNIYNNNNILYPLWLIHYLNCPRVIFPSHRPYYVPLFFVYIYRIGTYIYCMFTIHHRLPTVSDYRSFHGSRNDAFYLHHTYIRYVGCILLCVLQ